MPKRIQKPRSEKQKELDRIRARERYAADPEKFKTRVKKRYLEKSAEINAKDNARKHEKRIAMSDEEYAALRDRERAYEQRAAAKNPDAVKERWKRWAAENPDKIRANSKRWREANPEKLLEHHYRSKYGISLAEYDRMESEQNGVCAICKRPESVMTGRKSDPKRSFAKLSVDHCHKTGRIRGLLNQSCNLMIALAGDDPAVLRAAAEYLERFKK